MVCMLAAEALLVKYQASSKAASKAVKQQVPVEEAWRSARYVLLYCFTCCFTACLICRHKEAAELYTRVLMLTYADVCCRMLAHAVSAC
jgi:hypothetical protein